MPARPQWLPAIPDAIRQLERFHRNRHSNAGQPRLPQLGHQMLAPLLLPAELRALPVRPQLPQQPGARQRPRIPGQIGAERVHQLRRVRTRDPEQLLDVATREQLPVQGLEGRLSGLPAGVVVERDRIEVRYAGAKEAVVKLVALAQALNHDYERFEALVAGEGSSG